MGLAPAQPDQAVIDGLSLDAAWKRAEQCEAELRQVRFTLKAQHEAYAALSDRRLKLTRGVKEVLARNSRGEYAGQLDRMAGDLLELLEDE